MREWLDLHIGTDWATYQGWILGIASLGLTIYGLIRQAPTIKQRINNKKLKQTAKCIEGGLNQAGRDIINTTNNHYPEVSRESELAKKKHVHDLKIIEEILCLLPYEETIDQLERSYIVGMLFQFSHDLENAEKFTAEKFQLYNSDMENSKNKFIDSIKAFNDSYISFLSVDNPEKKPLRLDLPYDWRSKGRESESAYRKHQNNMRKTSGVMIECYKDFVRTLKKHNFITDKL